MDLTPWMPGGFLIAVGLLIFFGAPRGVRWVRALGLADALIGVAWVAWDWMKAA